ncbi:MAG: glycoside hydrolase family 3 C-terminal domain-containing protein [Lachnospiraceae bacterium]|nr:glycoside hydrolase family 3 C-terminal domain-containing protein [Lachnospiraceae bacterium]
MSEENKRYMDPSLPPQERAQDLLSQMSLDEKMGQIVGVMAIAGREDALRHFAPHGVGQVSTLGFRMCKTPQEAAAWQHKLQSIVMECSEHHIPAVFHMEGLCGAFIQDSTSFPSGVNRGATFDPELEEQIGAAVARQELAFGITQVLAPVLDISRDSRMGRQSEPYGEDPALAAAMGAAYTKGAQGTEVDGRYADCCAKHFLGFHNSQGGIHGAHIDAGMHLIDEIYGKPFQAAIALSDLHGVMPCYGSLDGLPVHASKKVLTGLLREEMGFDGVVISDYGAVENVHMVQGAAESNADAGLKCLAAGMDVELPMPSCYWNGLKAQFESGEADLAILDAAVLHVLTAKFRMGLFEHPFALEGEALTAKTQQAADDEISRRAAQESLILLKNNGALPLSKDVKTIALIGPHGTNARYYFGGYTHLSMVEAMHAAGNSMAGTGGGGSTANMEMQRVPGTNIQRDDTAEFDAILKQLYPGCQSLAEALQAALPNTRILTAQGYWKAGADESLFEEALAAAAQADVILLTLGGKNGSGSIATMGEGVDGTNINLPACQDAFIRAAAKYGKPMVGIHFDGRPISSDAADELLDAIVEAFTPAAYAAEAAANVLTGANNPSGKLPLSAAYNAGQIPIYYNHPKGSAWHQGASIGFKDYADLPHTPRYFFGHGLSYTDFAYSDLQIESEAGTITIENVPEASFATGYRPAGEAAEETIAAVRPDGEVRISLKVKNTGAVEGTEVVQLYIRDEKASMTRPVKELAGFARVGLQPGEEKQVCFTLRADQLAFLDEEMRWMIEKGTFDVQVGSSSEDIRLEGKYYVNSDLYISGRGRGFFAAVSVR